MPCTVIPTHEEERESWGIPKMEKRIKFLSENLNHVSRILCSLCGAIDAEHRSEEPEFWTIDDWGIEGLSEWWSDHKAADEARRTHEHKETLLKTLTVHDIALLKDMIDGEEI